MKKFTIFIILIGMIFSGCNANTSSLAYNSQNCLKTKFTQNQTINLPDFTLEYLGQTEQNRDLKLAPVHHFKINNQNLEKTLKWSSGTGDIGPIFFKFNEQLYSLELIFSKEMGKLAENEFALCKVDPQKYGIDLNSPQIQ